MELIGGQFSFKEITELSISNKLETKKVENDMTIVNEKHTTNSSDSDDISFVGVSTEGGKGKDLMDKEMCYT